MRRPHGNGKEFHISRSFKVHSRRIISAWSPLATGIMSELWRHLARRERLRSRNPLPSFSRINQYVSRYLCRKLDTPRRVGQRSSIVRFRAEKRVESFPSAGKESDIMITRVFTSTVGIAGIRMSMQKQQPSVICLSSLWQKNRSRCSWYRCRMNDLISIRIFVTQIFS